MTGFQTKTRKRKYNEKKFDEITNRFKEVTTGPAKMLGTKLEILGSMSPVSTARSCVWLPIIKSRFRIPVLGLSGFSKSLLMILGCLVPNYRNACRILRSDPLLAWLYMTAIHHVYVIPPCSLGVHEWRG